MDNNESPEEISTTVQNVSNESVLDLFSQVVEGAIKLVELLPSMSNAVKEIKEAEKHVQSALVGITATSDPDVVIELADLQKEFRAFIRVGKDFLENCLSMAKYATDKQHVTEIKEQLESKTLDELKVYIDSLNRYLKNCDESSEEFRTTHKKTEGRVSSAKGHFSDQHKEAKKEASDAVEKYERAVVKRTSGEALTITFAMVSSANALAGASGIIPPEVAACGSFFNLMQACLARINEGTAVLDVMEQERAREEMAKKEKILLDALNCVVKLYVSILNAASLVKEMKSHSNHASKVIDQKKEKVGGLQEFADSNEEDIDFYDLKNKLDKLQRAAGEILKVIGEDGITPISSSADKLAEAA